MGLAHRFIRGSALNLVDQVVKAVSVFVLTPVLLSGLGERDYGFWVLLMSVFGHYAVLDLGLSISVPRFLARAIGTKDDEELATLASTSFFLFFRVAVVAFFLSVAGWFLAPVWIGDPQDLRDSRIIIAIYGLLVSTGFLVQVFQGFLKSDLRYDLIVSASLMKVALSTGLILFFLGRGHGIVTLAIVNGCCGFLEYALVVFFALRSQRRLKISRKKIDPGRGGEIFKFSLVAFVNLLGKRLRMALDPLIIGAYVGVSSVTYYALGTRFLIYFMDVAGTVFGGQLLATFSQLAGKDDRQPLRRAFLGSTKLSVIFAIFCGSCLAFYGGAFLGAWVGSGFEDSYRVLLILVLPTTIYVIHYPALNILYALGQHKYLACLDIVGGVGNVVLSIALAQIIGLYGVVWATFAEMLIIYVGVLPVLVGRIAQIPLGAYAFGALVSPGVKCGILLVPFALLGRSVGDSYLELALAVTGQAAFFFPGAFWWVLDRGERKFVFSLFKRNQTD